MGQINVEKNVGGIEGLCVITPAVHGDDRGYFMETYNESSCEPFAERCLMQSSIFVRIRRRTASGTA